MSNMNNQWISVPWKSFVDIFIVWHQGQTTVVLAQNVEDVIAMIVAEVPGMTVKDRTTKRLTNELAEHMIETTETRETVTFNRQSRILQLYGQHLERAIRL